MQYVAFGNSGMQVSRMCLGAMMFGPKMDLAAAQRAVDEALDAGVNFIDTAESYGESEALLGQILDGRRESVYLATKVYTRRARGGKVGRNSRVNLLHSLERSLRLLKTDYVDLYQLHHPDPETPVQEVMATLDQAVRAGKVRYVGVSNHYAWQMAYMIGLGQWHGWEPIVSIQCRYNIFDRIVELETVPFCRRFNVAMMVYGPLCGGVLSGKYTQEDAPPPGSRGADGELDRYLKNPKTFTALEELQEIAGEEGVSLPQLAMLWLMAKPVVTTAILGGSKVEHFRVMYEIADRQLPEEVVRRIDELSEDWRLVPFLNQPVTQGPALAAQR